MLKPIMIIPNSQALGRSRRVGELENWSRTDIRRNEELVSDQTDLKTQRIWERGPSMARRMHQGLRPNFQLDWYIWALKQQVCEHLWVSFAWRVSHRAEKEKAHQKETIGRAFPAVEIGTVVNATKYIRRLLLPHMTWTFKKEEGTQATCSSQEKREREVKRGPETRFSVRVVIELLLLKGETKEFPLDWINHTFDTFSRACLSKELVCTLILRE